MVTSNPISISNPINIKNPNINGVKSSAIGGGDPGFHSSGDTDPLHALLGLLPKPGH